MLEKLIIVFGALVKGFIVDVKKPYQAYICDWALVRSVKLNSKRLDYRIMQNKALCDERLNVCLIHSCLTDFKPSFFS